MRGGVTTNGTAKVGAAQLAVLSRDGTAFKVEAESDAAFLMLSGAPIGEPIAAQGPFVMNTPGEIRQAMLDFRSGKFGAIR